MNLKYIIVCLVIHSGSLSTLELSAQFLLGEEAKIEFEDAGNYIFVEPHLYINPQDPDHWLVSTIATDTSEINNFKTMALTTFDGGKTWKHYLFERNETADPWGMINSEGHAVFTQLELSRETQGVFVYYSEDGGKSWNQSPYLIQGSIDHQTVAYNPSYGEVFVVGIKNSAVLVAKSEDNGRTFPIEYEHVLTNMNSNTMTAQVDSEGNLLVPFTTFQRRTIHDGNAWLQHGNALSWLVKSNDGGESLSPMIMIGEHCEKSFPVFAIDKTEGEYQNRGYYVCASQSERGIIFQYSGDEHNRWTDKRVLSKVMNVEPRDKNPFGGIPQTVVNNEGVVGVAWMDRRLDPKSKCQYVFFTYSKDGGKSFDKPIKISEQLSCPETERNGWLGNRWPAGGDYFGLDTDKNGDFIIVWPDSRTGMFQLYYRKISTP